jgi:hypothetical protein
MRLMGVETALHETLDPNAKGNSRFKLEERAIKTRLGNGATVQFDRITFLKLKDADKKLRGKRLAANDADFLGFVVIATIQLKNCDARSYAFEGVVREFSFNHGQTHGPWGSYLHVKRRFSCPLLEQSYELVGTFFCQQNTFTTVCAHACTAMLLNNSADVTYLVTCESVNQLLGIDHVRRMQDVPAGFGNNERATHEGLYSREIERVVREHGFSPYRNKTGSVRSSPHREFVYSFIESGYPALLTFNSLMGNGHTVAHVVTVVGHSLCRQSWFPAMQACYCNRSPKEKAYLSSLNWIDDFLVHDDNFGMQLYVPTHLFGPSGALAAQTEFIPGEAIGILPSTSNVNVLGYEAELTAWNALNAMFVGDEPKRSASADNYYVSHLRPHVTGEGNHPRTVVLRTLLLPRDRYLDQLTSQADNTGNRFSESDVESVRSLLQNHKQIWVVEVTEPELYVANGAKVMEILLDPTNSSPETTIQKTSLATSVILIRLPHVLLTVEQLKDGIRFNPIAFDGVKGHLPLLRLPENSNLMRLT